MINKRNSFSELGFLLFVLVALATAMVFRVIILKSVSKETIGGEIKGLVALMWITSNFLQFKALRKAQVFISWSILALIHLGMFIYLYNSNFMNYTDEYGIARNYSRLLVVPILLLIFFQVCRQFSVGIL
jgi:hypothetical protein